MGLVLVALVGTAFSQIPVGDFRFDGRLLGSHGGGGLSRSAGFFARVYDSTNPNNIPQAISASPPYATLFANIWLPRELKLRLQAFPPCPAGVVFYDPRSCPAHSAVGTGAAGGFARPVSAPPGVGSYQSLKMTIYAGGPRSFLLRATGATSAVIPGRLVKAPPELGRKFGGGIRFEIPINLIAPLGPSGGLISQLSTFSANLRSSRVGRTALAKITCPARGYVWMGFSGAFNSNLEQGDRGLGTSSPSNGLFSVSALSPLVARKVRCRHAR